MSTSTKTVVKLGYADYVRIPDDGLRHEIIDGVHFVNPAPSTYHQTVSKRLQHQLYTQIELGGLGVLFNAPVDVQFSPHDIVQPDLVVVLKNRPNIITPTKIKGVPDLLVEIVSPSSEDNDRRLKRERYEKAGVPEYWIVDPGEQTLEQLVLRDGVYQLQPAANEVRPAVIGGVVIRLLEVW